MVNQLTQVAGFSGAGIRVVASPADAEVLKKMGAQNNYWSTLIVKQIQQLTAGHLNSEYAYVSDLPGAVGAVRLKLPGCQVEVLKRSDSVYEILNIAADTAYYNRQMQGSETGFYYARKDSQNSDAAWKGTLQNSVSVHQHIKAANIATPVGVSDAYEKLSDAAMYSAEHIQANGKDLQGDQAIEKNGFNLFYNKGKRTYGGLGWKSVREAFNPEGHESFNESAVQLADIMRSAVNEKIIWVSQRGGSGVLTQAMGILAKMDVKLPKHQVLLSNATTSQKKAYFYIQKLGMQLGANDKVGTYNAFSIDETVGGLGFGVGYSAMLKARMQGEADYKFGQLKRDMKELNASRSKVAGAYTALGTAAAGVAMLAFPATAPAIAALTGAKLLTMQTILAGGAGAVAAYKIATAGFAGAKEIARANLPGSKGFANYQKVLDKRKGL